MQDIQVLKAKQIIKDSFWILESNEQKIGTMRHSNNTWQVLLEKDRQQFDSYSNVIEFLGEDPFTNDKKSSAEQPIQGDFDVEGYPTPVQPYNVEKYKSLPTYTKTPKSNVKYSAGYYGIEFPKGWVPSFNPKLNTLLEGAVSYVGPFHSEMEMNININNKKRERKHTHGTV
jgi:hypothetical protein